jgi:ketosteroid isomerase-like protein
VNSSPNSDIDSAFAEIAALREDWIAAVKASDADRLSAMVTDDVVVVHGNGRCVCGKNELRADFLKGFAQFAIDQRVSSAEVIVNDKWAFENR